MAVSDLPAQPLRQPRLLVLAGGTPLAGAVAADVTSNNHYAADRFSVTLAASADPFAIETLTEQDSVLIELQLSLDGGNTYTSLITGEADCLALDPLSNTVTLEGRDLSARLIEARSEDVFANQTASDIATTLAGRHGLTANVQHTTTLVGRYWNSDRNRVSLDHYARHTSEWDLLARLAAAEGFDVWVSGTTLNFRPTPDPQPQSVTPQSFTRLSLDHALTLAGDIEVVVKSWNPRTQAGCNLSASRAGSGGRAQRYVYVLPNLTTDEAQRYADLRLTEITRHERVLTAEMPGELSLAPRQALTLAGVGLGFDQTYWIDRVDRHLSVSHGFRQTLTARNANAGPAPDAEASPWTDSSTS
jgi:phage protein D